MDIAAPGTGALRNVKRTLRQAAQISGFYSVTPNGGIGQSRVSATARNNSASLS